MINIFKWFLKPKVKKCQHYKNTGEKYPNNMFCFIRFEEKRKTQSKYSYDYGIAQCRECGKRAFQCCMCHFLYDHQTIKIDEFIDYKITLDELIEFFKKEKFVYEILDDHTS